MARWHGVIGFSETVETAPGVWAEQLTEREYYGKVLQNFSQYQSSDGLNDDINVANKISIIADPYANQKSHSMRYVEFMGANWNITKVEVRYPRLILTIGGVYNGEQA